MCKILEANFRKELYKSLKDAGYDNVEAQKIVGTKYYTSLKDKTLTAIDEIQRNLMNDSFTDINFSEMENDFKELSKMNAFLNGDKKAVNKFGEKKDAQEQDEQTPDNEKLKIGTVVEQADNA
jgi:hypothetical protein